MKKVATLKTRILAKKITPPFLDWQESYADLLNFEETSSHHQWLGSDIEFYFFTAPVGEDFYDQEAWVARSAFGPELASEEEVFTYDLAAGEAMRYELPLKFWDFHWKDLILHYQKAREKLQILPEGSELQATWRLKLIGGEKIVMEFFTDNGQ